jgi:D-alanine-D-alanine ligase
MDKSLFKDVMRANEIPVAESVLLSRDEIDQDIQAAISHAESVSAYPIFVKPANLGSSVGVTRCTNRSSLIEGLREAARFDRRILVEQGLNAREIEVSVLGNDNPRASIPGEIRPSDDFYSYEAKYLSTKSELMIPAPLSSELTTRIQMLAVKAFKACDCAGMARVDFLLDRTTEQIYVSEINTIPGFTKISMYPKLWEYSGIPYPVLIDELVKLAIERKVENDRNEHQYRRDE